MSFTPEREKLRGLSLEVAECYGKPHIHALYVSESVMSHTLTECAVCACCGKRARNVHHQPPLSKGRTFLLMTEWGRFVLKPALFALCGSGTMGCHNGFHGGARFKARWVWDTDEHARMWWSGELLKSIPAHSPILYRYGRWVIRDRKAGRTYEYREDRVTVRVTP